MFFRCFIISFQNLLMVVVTNTTQAAEALVTDLRVDGTVCGSRKRYVCVILRHEFRLAADFASVRFDVTDKGNLSFKTSLYEYERGSLHLNGNGFDKEAGNGLLETVSSDPAVQDTDRMVESAYKEQNTLVQTKYIVRGMVQHLDTTQRL